MTFEPNSGALAEPQATPREKPHEKPAIDARYYDEATELGRLAESVDAHVAQRLARDGGRHGPGACRRSRRALRVDPLESVEVVTLLVDKTTGFVEVAQPLERGGELSQRESVLRANVVRFIRARETYDPKGLRDNFDLGVAVLGGRGGQGPRRRFRGWQSAQSHEEWGPETTIAVSSSPSFFSTSTPPPCGFRQPARVERTDAVSNIGSPMFAFAIRRSRCGTIGASIIP